jgi:hypothetical protein
MMVQSFYKGYRVETNAVLVDGAWDAEVRIRRALTDDQARIEHVTCRKLNAQLAETSGMIFGRRWVDLYGENGELSAASKTAAQVGKKGGWLRAMGSSRRSA